MYNNIITWVDWKSLYSQHNNVNYLLSRNYIFQYAIFKRINLKHDKYEP